jgi:hypothetical protein
MRLLISLFLISACGTYHKNRINPRGKDGTSCTTRQDSVGVYVECSDGTDSFIPFPKDGKDGESIQGPQGETVVGPTQDLLPAQMAPLIR